MAEEEIKPSLKEDALRLFRDISDGSAQVSALLKNLQLNLSAGDVSTKHGISLLDVKNCIMLQYLTNLTYIMSLKASGKTIEDNPVIDSLIEGRVYLERIRPIEQKLKYQIEKLIRVATTGVIDENDPSKFKANPENMLAKFAGSSSEDEDDETEHKQAKKTGAYVPPKLAPVHYDGDETKKVREQKLLERARKQALHSSVIQELKEEYLDTPVEITSTNSLKQKENKYLKQKTEYEESYFTRLPDPKEERKKRKKITTVGTLGEEITRFEDITALEDGADLSQVLKSSKKRKRAPNKKKGKFKKKRRFR